MTLDSLLPLSRAELAGLLRDGSRLDPEALADREFHGTSLGMPAVVDRLLWKKFKKVFVRRGDRLEGFNQAVEQNPIAEPWIDRRVGGELVRYGHYALRIAGEGDPPRYRGHTLIDYGQGIPCTQSMRLVRDPLVSLSGGSTELLLGVSYLRFARRGLVLPSYFCLQPGARLRSIATSPSPSSQESEPPPPLLH